ncbi:hypothetical protein [Actinoplanes couchii]|uniref:Lipoprotein n=1 Tax=Actinoplanes couchii TaxID=403638 RepID=A0ABQ3XD41_9ACTN|nr:hypothetical protein [Actinoplanes couchii]MDR6321327.1 putative lipoprotein with Yx(FWY)xxD motif [Actinoplanes couchii]GID56437.1 hypothetical protein Aco03nite_048410 [Actinoplanes couchii]
MKKMRWWPMAAMVASAAVLTACGGTEPAAEQPAPPAAAPSAADFELVSGTAKTNDATPGTGDWALMNGGEPAGDQVAVSERWVQLTGTKVGDLGGGVTNGAGLTLYRFDDDSAKPSKSTCVDDCAKKWPPVTVDADGKVFIAGVKKSAVNFVKRPDGKLQVTIAGWPVYRFAQDTRPGDVKGQGVGGTWFAVTPKGKKLTGDAKDTDAGPEVTEGVAEQEAAAKKAVLFSETDFSDKAATQAVTGGDCVDVGLTVRSVTADGRFFVWNQPGCKGERKEFGDEGAADLAGFDVKSIKLR